MAGVRNADLIDLIATTLPDLPEQYFEVTWTNQDYEACRIYQRDRMEVDGGTSIKRKVMFDPTGNARYRRAFDTDDPGVSDVMHEIDVPWTQLGTHYSWDKIEILRNSEGFHQTDGNQAYRWSVEFGRSYRGKILENAHKCSR